MQLTAWMKSVFSLKDKDRHSRRKLGIVQGLAESTKDPDWS